MFEPGLGRDAGPPVQLTMKPDAQPKFCRARPVPFSYRPAVEEELARMEREGIIERVAHSEWASPIVCVAKEDGSVRLCGDYKRTVNPACQADQYPMPKVEEMLASLSGCQRFTKIDLSQAYLQLPLAPESRKYTTINTHKGLYQFTRMPFGISAASAIFQKRIEEVLQGLRCVLVRADDILVSGVDDADHMRNLEGVLTRLREAGLRAKRAKCHFMEPEVKYMGYAVSESGHRPVEDKAKAVLEAPEPKDTTQLKSYLGMLNYYGRFLPNLATVLEPLHWLLRKGNRWCWGRLQQEAFGKTKRLLGSAEVLMHYDPKLPVRVECDASPYGVGAVLSHQLPNGVERPVAYASRTMNDAERNYAQFDREALAVVFAVRHFHNYLVGREFTLVTDHEPLLGVFGEAKPVPLMASNRLIRWVLRLQGYTYHLQHRPGRRNQNADALSRLPCPPKGGGVVPGYTRTPAETTLLIKALQGSVVTANDISRETQRDTQLARVRRHVQSGWPPNVEAELKPYWSVRRELSTHDGCILRGARIVVPAKLRQECLTELHTGHPGIVRMKGLARSYMWWPGIDRAIEEAVNTCHACQQTKPKPPSSPVHPWEWPAQPWERLHIDYAGPLEGRMLLVVVDAHSKWIEVGVSQTSTSATTIGHLRRMFATHGLPKALASDNGPAFTSNEFADFLAANGIRHIRTAPYHPSSNGQAERAVQVVKQGLARQSGSLEERLAKFLLSYRVTPHTTTGAPPCQLLMGRALQTRLDRLYPAVEDKVHMRQEQQANSRDGPRRMRQFSVGDLVYALKAQGSQSRTEWCAGVVIAKTGPLSYMCDMEGMGIRRYHVDQLRERRMRPPQTADEIVDSERYHLGNPLTLTTPSETAEEQLHAEQLQGEGQPKGQSAVAEPTTTERPEVKETGEEPSPQSEPRRSTRVRKPPVRFGFGDS